MPNTTTFAVVAGSGEFPFDMLRYDCCYPLDCTDAKQLEEDKFDYRFVIVARDKEGEFHPERWKSFTWRVVGHSKDKTAIELLKVSCIQELNEKKKEAADAK